MEAADALEVLSSSIDELLGEDVTYVVFAQSAAGDIIMHNCSDLTELEEVIVEMKETAVLTTNLPQRTYH
jgi:hypothetical protein